MKLTAGLFAALALTFGMAAGSTAAVVPPAPAGEVISEVPIELYPCVRYKDLKNVHPCAVPTVISIVDPCAPRRGSVCCQPVSCCAPKACCCPPPMVNVKICVPPCPCPDVRVSRDGRRIKYRYGKYSVTVTSRKGVVTVNYND